MFTDPPKDIPSTRATELEQMLLSTARSPGIAEVLAFHQQHAAFLAQANAYLGTRAPVASFDTTDSTG